jgi:hypothetical protein
MKTLNKKIMISAGKAVLLVAVNHPWTYKLTNKILPLHLFDESTGCPTNTGRLVHILVFSILSYLSMWNKDASPGLKFKYTLYGALIAYFITSPAMYATVGSVLGPKVSNANGCPTTVGVILHALVYGTALVGVMYLPDKGSGSYASTNV